MFLSPGEKFTDARCAPRRAYANVGMARGGITRDGPSATAQTARSTTMHGLEITIRAARPDDQAAADLRDSGVIRPDQKGKAT